MAIPCAHSQLSSSYAPRVNGIRKQCGTHYLRVALTPMSQKPSPAPPTVHERLYKHYNDV
jgi:hypothetical protein